MKALVLDGARGDDGVLDDLQAIVVQELGDAGATVDAVLLREKDIAYCLGCFNCWVKTPGLCTTNDEARDIARRQIQSDVTVLLTPVTFGGYSSEAKKILDRLIPNLSPFFAKIDGETHHKKRYERYPRLVTVGVLMEPDEESEGCFRTLVSRNAINMHPPAYATGVVAANQSADEMRVAIRELLAAVGVGQ